MLFPFAAACTASGCAVTTNLTPLWYVLGILGSLVIVVGAAFKGYGVLRTRLVQEGKEKADLAAALDANTKAATDNTAAIGTMNQRMADYMQHTDERLSGHQRRIERLEDRLPRSPH